MELDATNAERQAIERRILDEAIQLIETSAGYPGCRSIVLASRSWHQGVVGIVASRVAERYHRPTILISLGDEGSAKGSGRSIPAFTCWMPSNPVPYSWSVLAAIVTQQA